MVAIIDYGLGNIMSVAAAVRKVGFEPIISNRLEDLERAEKLILPGVGAFGDGMKNLKALGLVEVLTRLVLGEKKPILGICLGSQLMARESFEFGHHRGLGWIDASVVKIEANGLRIPHVGWNDLNQVKVNILFDGVAKDDLFYYVHSFYVRCNDPNVITGECVYGIKFTASFNQKNIFATQFHPEKSQLAGLTLLKNFLSKA